MVLGPLGVPKTLSWALQGQTYFCNNTKTSLFSFSLSHESSRGPSRGYMTFDDIIILVVNGTCTHGYSSIEGDFLGKLLGVISNFV